MATTGPTSTEAYPDEYIGDQSVEACIVMTALATFFLSFRFYSKFALVGAPWGWEDTLLVGAYVFHEGLCVLGIRKLGPPPVLRSPPSASSPSLLADRVKAETLYGRPSSLGALGGRGRRWGVERERGETPPDLADG